MNNSPFVGPRPFEKEDSDLFFGRIRETEELLSLVIAHRAVLVYAQSGAGKTSLLKAGVIKRLEEQQFAILPPARVHGLLPNDVTPESVQNIFVFHACQCWAAKLPSGQSMKNHVETTLSEFLRLLAPAPETGEESPPPLVVIFDQFEEFFTTNTHRWQERQPFFEQLTKALQDLPTLKVVFVMREEYIAQLDPFAELLPEKLRTRLHLERLRGNAARSAVVKPFQAWALSFDPVAADELMAELSQIRVADGDKFREAHGEFVEPVQLQVVCQSLWENLPIEWRNGEATTGDSSRQITLEYVDRFGDVNNALARYYDRSVERAAAASQGEIGEGELRRWIGKALITPTGTRGLALRAAPGATGRIPGAALRELEDAHVIRREDRGGTTTHELIHDRFIEPIQKSNEVWLARYEDAERIRAKLEERAARSSTELLDELELREAESYLNSPEMKILGATREARLLVERSRQQLEHAKRRQAEELQEALRRAQEQERLHKAESERADAERARAEAIARARWRERIFATFTALVLIGLLWVSTGYWWKLHVEKKQRTERGKDFLKRAESVNVTNDPTGKVTALRNLSIALRNNPKDTKAAASAAQLLIENTWCPPLSPDVGYDKDALLAAAFAPGNENEVFVVSGDGELLRWKKGQKTKLESLQHLFDKPATDPNKPSLDEVALFSIDARWLFVLMPAAVATEDGSHRPAEPATQGLTSSAPGSSYRDGAKIRFWVWSDGTYQQAGSDVDLPVMPLSRTTLTWNERAQHVIAINATRFQTECHVFQVARYKASERQQFSEELTRKNVVAAGASPDGGLLAIGTMTGSVELVSPDNYQAINETAERRAKFQMQDGFQPIGINFGPAENELTLSSWYGMRTLKTNGDVRLFQAPNFRDKVIRRVVSSGPDTPRLVATVLYGRVEVARTDRVDKKGEPIPAEPIVLRGTTAIPQFSRDGRRLLTLSGGQNALDTLRVSDVSTLNDSRPIPVANFKSTPPIWLADLAAAVSALDAASDGSLLTLKRVRKKHEKQKAAGPYDIVWKRFFPDERTGR